MAPLVVDPCGYLKPHHSVGHCRELSGPSSQGARLRGTVLCGLGGVGVN